MTRSRVPMRSPLRAFHNPSGFPLRPLFPSAPPYTLPTSHRTFAKGITQRAEKFTLQAQHLQSIKDAEQKAKAKKVLDIFLERDLPPENLSPILAESKATHAMEYIFSKTSSGDFPLLHEELKLITEKSPEKIPVISEAMTVVFNQKNTYCVSINSRTATVIINGISDMKHVEDIRGIFQVNFNLIDIISEKMLNRILSNAKQAEFVNLIYQHYQKYIHPSQRKSPDFLKAILEYPISQDFLKKNLKVFILDRFNHLPKEYFEGILIGLTNFDCLNKLLVLDESDATSVSYALIVVPHILYPTIICHPSYAKTIYRYGNEIAHNSSVKLAVHHYIEHAATLIPVLLRFPHLKISPAQLVEHLDHIKDLEDIIARLMSPTVSTVRLDTIFGLAKQSSIIRKILQLADNNQETQVKLFEFIVLYIGDVQAIFNFFQRYHNTAGLSISMITLPQLQEDFLEFMTQSPAQKKSVPPTSNLCALSLLATMVTAGVTIELEYKLRK